MNGTERRVFKQWKEGDLSWFPIGRAKRLKNDEEQELDIERKLEFLIEKVGGIEHFVKKLAGEDKKKGDERKGENGK